MTYLTEFRTEWRALLAAFIGMGAGLGYTATTTSIFAPNLIAEFGWTKAEFALTQTLMLLLVVTIPLSGRLTDVFGVRRTAMIGVLSLPVIYLTMSAMTGDIRQYLALYIAQLLFCATTTATVYSRIIVDHFRTARGMALAIGASGAAFAGFLITPALNELVDAQGWRTGYQALALFAFVTGLIALFLIPARPDEGGTAEAPVRRGGLGDYAAIARMPVFWLLALALLLCNFPQVLAISQLKLLLLDNGVAGSTISIMLSLYSAGTLLGRFFCGLALDRLPMHFVAAIGLGLPAVGVFIFASPLDAPWLLALGVLFLGLSYGAEGDILGYVVARIFGLGIYSTVLGLISGTISLSVAVASVILSLTLDATGNFALFLIITGVAVLAGSSLFLLLGRRDPKASAMPQAAASG